MDVEIPGVGGGDGGGAAVADPPADGAPADDPGAGGGDGAPADDPGAAGGDADPDAAAGGEGGAKDEADLSDIETDGRKIDAKTRAEIAELKKTNPAAAKKWAESYFRNQALMKEVPEAKTSGEAIAKIREMKATIDSLGGEEGITNLQTEVQDYRNEIAQFAAGDPKLIAELGESNPEGLATAGSNALNWLKANKADVYKDTLTPHLNEMLEGQGLDTTLDQLLALTKDGKGQEVYDLLQKVVKWRAGHKDKVKALTEGKTAKNPEAEKLAKDREDFEKQKAKDFQTRVETDVNRWNNPEIDKHVNPLQKELGLQKQGMNHFRNGLVSRIWAALASDQSYLKQVRTLRAKGDSVKTADFVHKAFIEILPEQFRLHRNEVYPNLAKAKAAPAAAAAAGNGKPKTAPINLAAGARPKADQVDWTKTTDAMYATGKAYLKDGKFIQGFKDAPPNRY